MIRVEVKTRDDKIEFMEITGHADFGDHSHDIVCSAMSSIGTGLLNAIDIMCPEDCKLILENNLIQIEVIHDSDKLQNILYTGLYQFKTVEEKFDLYVEVIITEV